MTFTLSNGSSVGFFEYTTSTRYAVTEHSNFRINGNCYQGIDKWYNRPWYKYQYQNARFNAISSAVAARTQEIKEKILLDNNKKRMTKALKPQFDLLLQSDEQIKLLEELKVMVEECNQ